MLSGMIKDYDEYLSSNSRYNESQLETYKGRVMYDAPQHEMIKRSDSDKYIELRVGNSYRIDNLAMNHFGDSKLYWIIAMNNRIRNPLTTKPGDLVVLPSINSSIMSGVMK